MTWVLDDIANFMQITYNIVTGYISGIVNYIRFLADTFPFDNSKKTLMLSIIYVVVIFAILIMFAGRSTYTGVGELSPIQVDVWGEGGSPGGGEIGATSTTSAGLPGSTSTTAPPLQDWTYCNTDIDCNLDEDGYSLGQYLCCYATEFQGYSCAGKCLKIDVAESERANACKHPNACFFLPQNIEGFKEHIKDASTANICASVLLDIAKQPTQDEWCRRGGTNDESYSQTAYCCDDMMAPCFGFCTSGGATNCFDYKSCPEENQASVISLLPLGGGVS